MQDTEHIHILYWLGTYIAGGSLALKGTMDCLLSQQPGQLHEPLLLAMVCGLDQQDMIIGHIKRGIEVMLQLGEKENRLITSRNSNKLTILWPMKSLEILESFLVSILYLHIHVHVQASKFRSLLFQNNNHSTCAACSLLWADELYSPLCNQIFSSFQIHPLLNENLKDPSILEDLCGTLKSSMEFIEHIFSNEEASINSSDVPVSFIVQCFSLYVRIIIHLKLKVHRRILENLE